MKLNYRRTTYILLAIVASLLVTIGGLAATGTTDSTGAPGATNSYTLTDIYNRINNGTAGTQSTFTEPGVAPGTGTMQTLNEIYDLASERSRPPETGDTFTDAGVTGEDGELRKGVDWPSPRFTDNSNGTVTDNLTGLIWVKNANCYGTRNLSTAFSDAAALASGTCGLTDGSSAGDWRLPNVRELNSLIDYGRSSPALPSGHPFTGVVTLRYWSSTSNANNPSFVWNTNLNDGQVSYGLKTDSRYVWPVRGGQ